MDLWSQIRRRVHGGELRLRQARQEAEGVPVVDDGPVGLRQMVPEGVDVARLGLEATLLGR